MTPTSRHRLDPLTSECLRRVFCRSGRPFTKDVVVALRSLGDSSRGCYSLSQHHKGSWGCMGLALSRLRLGGWNALPLPFPTCGQLAGSGVWFWLNNSGVKYAWVLIPAPPIPCCVILDLRQVKSFSELQFPHLENKNQ